MIKGCNFKFQKFLLEQFQSSIHRNIGLRFKSINIEKLFFLNCTMHNFSIPTDLTLMSYKVCFILQENPSLQLSNSSSWRDERSVHNMIDWLTWMQSYFLCGGKSLSSALQSLRFQFQLSSRLLSLFKKLHKKINIS